MNHGSAVRVRLAHVGVLHQALLLSVAHLIREHNAFALLSVARDTAAARNPTKMISLTLENQNTNGTLHAPYRAMFTDSILLFSVY